MKSKMTNTIKYPLYLLLITLLTACNIVDPGDEVSDTNFEAKESFSFEVDVTNHVRLRLEAVNGPVKITGLPGANSVKNWGERRVGSESIEDAELHLQDLEVQVTEPAEEIFVKTKQPQDSRGRNYIVNYNITLPENLEVLVDNVNGEVKIDSVKNQVSVSNVNGRINLNDIFGSTVVNLVNGQIESEVTLPVDGTINMNTVNGNIDLDIPENTSAEFSANVTNGNISVSNLVLQNIVSSPNSLRGTLAAGQGTISLRTVNGNIWASGF
ncbi:MAG: DUF4097 domain-containing protein [bacterium]